MLGKAPAALPFDVASSTETKEEVRLKYRYLDLRNPKVHSNIVLRSQVISHLRRQDGPSWAFWRSKPPFSPAPPPRGPGIT